jgi:DNA-binding response OmpR family regulator
MFPLPTILIVEDDADVHAPLKLIIQQAGYKTLSAHSFEEARKVVASEAEFDLVLTDIDLGDHRKGGIELGKLLAASKSEIPILYTSGREASLKIELSVNSRSAFLAKPYERDDVLAHISSLLQAAGVR